MTDLKFLPAVLLLGLAPLAACSGDDSTTESKDEKCATFESGSASKAVKVTGEFGKTNPKATFTTPLEADADDLQRTILDQGEGGETAAGDQVESVISVFNGRTGKRALSQAATLIVGDENTFEAFRAGIECVSTGSRIVTTVAAADVYGDEGLDALDIKATDSLVIVTDVVKLREPVKAHEWSEDVPKVSFDDLGTPKVTLPKSDAPKDVRVKVLEQGDGDTVAAGDTITANYQGLTWPDGEIFQQTWGETKGGTPTALALDQLVQGFQASVIGQQVGSTVLMSMPAEYAFGAEASEQNELAGKDVVFVVEIVSIES